MTRKEKREQVRGQILVLRNFGIAALGDQRTHTSDRANVGLQEVAQDFERWLMWAVDHASDEDLEYAFQQFRAVLQE